MVAPGISSLLYIAAWANETLTCRSVRERSKRDGTGRSLYYCEFSLVYPLLPSASLSLDTSVTVSVRRLAIKRVRGWYFISCIVWCGLQIKLYL